MAIVEMEIRVPCRPDPPRTGLARREALWGLAFISPWLIGFLFLTLAPMVATFVFTFTNINLIQDSAASVRRAGQLRRSPRRRAHVGRAAVTFKFAAIALPIGLILPFADRAAPQQQVAARVSLLPGALLHAVRDPVRGRHSSRGAGC